MRHPVWIGNSILLFLFLFVLIFLYLYQAHLPKRESIDVKLTVPSKKRELVSSINIVRIYEQDLFGTYHKENEYSGTPEIPSLPAPPNPIIAQVPKAPEPQFVEPLDITLKGIIVVNAQEDKNRALIEDNKTKNERVCQIGDLVDDAQLIRIFGNKIILLRSNGQQEVLYLREQDAKVDPVYTALGNWQEVVYEDEDGTFTIIRNTFTHRIKNLAHFIDLLDLTTAFKEGISIGCRVGALEQGSLGSQLGLKANDIITHINSIPTASTQDRLKIYKSVITISDYEEISVSLLRNNNPMVLTYILESKKQERPNLAAQEKEKADFQKQLLERKQKLAPTLDQLRTQEKQHMLQMGRAPRAQMPEQSLNNGRSE